MPKKITSWEVVVLSTVFVFLAGLVIELVNWLTGNSLWEYKIAGLSASWYGIFDHLIFGTVPLGVLLGWIFAGVVVGVLTAFVAKRIGR